jgi:hypothetical protein
VDAPISRELRPCCCDGLRDAVGGADGWGKRPAEVGEARLLDDPLLVQHPGAARGQAGVGDLDDGLGDQGGGDDRFPVVSVCAPSA